MEYKIQDDKSVFPLEDLLIEAYDNKDDLNHIESIMIYVDKNKYDYTLISLSTLKHTLRGYYYELKKV